MKYNGEFKNVDTQEKAYLLGQIYGDGYNGYIKSYKLMLASINTDVELYTNLSILFPFLKLKTYLRHSNMIYLECYNKECSLDLKSLGMWSNKTKNDITGEFHFPNLRKDLISHFIRGYFDADGSFWFPSRARSRNNLRCEFSCATKNFILALKKYLDDEGIFFTYKERVKKAGNSKYYRSYELYSSNRELSLKFANYIYKDASIFLQRKYNISKQNKELKDSADKLFGNCSYCNSSNIIKNGIRNGKHRLKCKDCNKGFTRKNADLSSNA